MLTESDPKIPFFLQGTGEMVTLMRQKDWSKSPIGSPETWPQSLKTTLSLLLRSRFPMFLFWGPELICFYNDAYRPSLGNEGKHPTALGERGEVVWPEIWPMIKPLIDQVLSGGEATWSEDQLIPIYRDGQIQDVYWTFSYSPVDDESGRINGVFVTCMETTQEVLSRRQMEANSRQMLDLFGQAPVAIAIFRGPDHVIELANEAHLKIWDRTAEQVIGKPVFEAIPEARGQGFEELLANVLTTGESFYANELYAQLIRNGKPEMVYFNFVYQALRELDGTITGVIVVANEITEQVESRKKVENSELRLSLALDASQIGVWELNITDDTAERSPRHDQIFGYDKALPAWGSRIFRDHIYEADRPIADACFEEAFESGSLFMQVRIVRPDQTLAWIEARGKTLYDTFGKPQRLIGVVADITAQKQTAQQLEQLVVERTESLRQVNADLERSNLDLMQFASVASHDLKEPLRKVQTFGSQLAGLLADRMSLQESDLFQRMINATVRMQDLVNDVLRLSKLSDQTVEWKWVDLTVIIRQIQVDLELPIQEAQAQLIADPLPTIWAEPAQMHQLFLNLISNALKFQDGDSPVIQINQLPPTHEWVQAMELPTPDYRVIAVTDNGIGFDPAYKDKIFGMFQRLHGRSRYAGTGIGLTIVKKIVDNHGGQIDVQTEPGRGTTFLVALPAPVSIP